MQDQKLSILQNISTFKALDNFSVILSDATHDQKLSLLEKIAILRALDNFGVIPSDAMQ